MHTVLVVDSCSKFVTLVVAALRPQGQMVMAADSIAEAENLATLTHPDVLLINLAMPGALDLLRTVHEDLLEHRIRIIGLSDPISDELAKEATSLGAAELLTKSAFNVGTLQQCVTMHLGHAHSPATHLRGAA